MHRDQRGAHGVQEAINQLMARQRGLITREQALAVGLTARQVEQCRLAAGSLRSVYPRVFASASAPTNWEQNLLGACLWAGSGSAASHRAAGQLWQLSGIPGGFVEITTNRNVRRQGVVVHRMPLRKSEVGLLNGIPVTSVDRTLLDLAGVLDEDGLELALESAFSKRLVRFGIVERQLDINGGQGRKGALRLRHLVQERKAVGHLSASELEIELRELIKRSNLPNPVKQYEIRLPQKTLRVDLAYPEALVALEADSYRWHSSKRAWEEDLRRRNRLTSLGWLVLHFTRVEIRKFPSLVIGQIRNALIERGMLLA